MPPLTPTNPCFPPDLTPITTDGGAVPQRVLIIVGPLPRPTTARSGRTRRLAMVAADRRVLVHAEIDAIAAGPFVAEAIGRSHDKWGNNIHIQVVIDLGTVATGVIVPCPPPGPKFSANFDPLFEALRDDRDGVIPVEPVPITRRPRTPVTAGRTRKRSGVR
jgi:hypothetical protein